MTLCMAAPGWNELLQMVVGSAKAPTVTLSLKPYLVGEASTSSHRAWLSNTYVVTYGPSVLARQVWVLTHVSMGGLEGVDVGLQCGIVHVDMIRPLLGSGSGLCQDGR